MSVKRKNPVAISLIASIRSVLCPQGQSQFRGGEYSISPLADQSVISERVERGRSSRLPASRPIIAARRMALGLVARGEDRLLNPGVSFTIQDLRSGDTRFRSRDSMTVLPTPANFTPGRIMMHDRLLFTINQVLILAGLIVPLSARGAESTESSATQATSVRSEDAPGFVSLFDGRTLAGWKAADMTWWSVEDGAITARITAEKPCDDNQYLFCEVGEMRDFELKLTHRVLSSHDVNCGFQFRSEHYEGDDCKGYQVDNNLPDLIRLYDEFGRHTLAMRGERTVFHADGTKSTTEIAEAQGEPWFDLKQWHEYHLICRGPSLTLRVNGRLVAEVVDNDPGNRDLSGLLALQLHSGPPMTVQFKDIRWKRLDENAATRPAPE